MRAIDMHSASRARPFFSATYIESVLTHHDSRARFALQKITPRTSSVRRRVRVNTAREAAYSPIHPGIRVVFKAFIYI